MTTPKRPKSDVVDYAALQAELTELTDQLEQGALGIDEAVAGYERGLIIIQQLERHLQHAENRVRALQQQYDAGEAE